LGDIWETVSGSDLVLLLISDSAQVRFMLASCMISSFLLLDACLDSAAFMDGVTLHPVGLIN
jgi:hypothetical protein